MPTEQAVKAYADAITTAMTLDGISDYDTSGTTGTAKTQNALEIVYGTRSIGGSSSATITNLPFASATSYVVVLGQSFTPASADETSYVRNSGSQITIYNASGGAKNIGWIAIGT